MYILMKRDRIALVVSLLLLMASSSAFSQDAGAGGSTSQTPSTTATTSPTATSQPSQPSANNSQKLSVNPVTGQTTASASNYTPLTEDERWKLYFKQSYWSVGAYLGPVFSALALDQATDSPRQWGGGFAGYGRRLASRVASGDVVQNSIQFPLAAVFHEDVRYIASGDHGFRRRAVHSIVYSFMTYNNQGRETFNFANVLGYYGSADISTFWLPGPQKRWSYTLSNGSESAALSVPVNMLQEFWPEISGWVHHRL